MLNPHQQQQPVGNQQKSVIHLNQTMNATKSKVNKIFGSKSKTRTQKYPFIRFRMNGCKHLILGVCLCCYVLINLLATHHISLPTPPMTDGSQILPNHDLHSKYSDMSEAITSSSTDSIAVFYNVFTKDEESKSLVQQIVNEQLSHIRPEHELHIVSIGVPLEIKNTTSYRHVRKADEMITLRELWEYCQLHTTSDAKVVYIHSKGSFHPSSNNDKLRRFLTRGALSKECADLPSSCNVCSSRMSPLPHPHTSGNMWLARCDYVRKLIEPRKFKSKMNEVYLRTEQTNIRPYCIGKSRFAAEHWIYSHFDVSPCDLLEEDHYVWAYDGVPDYDFPKNLKPAPRFELSKYFLHSPEVGCQTIGRIIEDRLKEYKILYGKGTISESWWGWSLFNETYDVDKAML